MATVSGEDAARLKAAENNTAVDDAVTDDPTGGTREQVAAKQASNAMGDQDEANTAYQYPSGAELPTAQNVRRYPELFSDEVIESFQVEEEPVADDTTIADAYAELEDGADVPLEPVGDNLNEADDNGEVDTTTTSGYFSSGNE